MKQPTIDPVRIQGLLRRIGLGISVPKLANPEVSLRDPMCGGDVEFTVDGWGVTIFNDCGEYDYIGCIKSPEGWEMGYDEFTDLALDRDLEIEDNKCYKRMVKAFVNAK